MLIKNTTQPSVYNSPNNSLIELCGITKSFANAAGVTTVLKDINLKVKEGEFLAIVGKSGSGKSTLLNMITGIDHPSQGSVTINSTDVHTLKESRLAKWRGENIGIVFQFYQLIPTLTILENLLLAMDFVNVIPKKERRKWAELLLEQVDISQHADKLPAALSGGEQQRAAIARALSNNPSIIVADEPTGNLDSKTAEDISALFAKLAESGKTVIVVTHENVSGPDHKYDHIITLTDGIISLDQKTNQKQRGG